MWKINKDITCTLDILFLFLDEHSLRIRFSAEIDKISLLSLSIILSTYYVIHTIHRINTIVVLIFFDVSWNKFSSLKKKWHLITSICASNLSRMCVRVRYALTLQLLHGLRIRSISILKSSNDRLYAHLDANSRAKKKHILIHLFSLPF